MKTQSNCISNPDSRTRRKGPPDSSVSGRSLALPGGPVRDRAFRKYLDERFSGRRPKPSLVALVRPLSRPFPPFGQRSLSAHSSHSADGRCPPNGIVEAARERFRGARPSSDWSALGSKLNRRDRDYGDTCFNTYFWSIFPSLASGAIMPIAQEIGN